MGAYRYGFNGKENDNEVKGVGNEIDYGMRVYDPRAGRFMSVDPISESFPWNSPYAYAENDVIRSKDIDGLEKSVNTLSFSVSNGRTVMQHTSDNYVQPEGTFHIGFAPQTTKEIIAHALVTCLKVPKLPDNGDFVFVEFPDHSQDNHALYYYTNANGEADIHVFPGADIDWMYDQLGIAQKNLSKVIEVASAVGNLAAAGSIAKSELRTMAGEAGQSLNEAGLKRLNEYNFTRQYKATTFDGEQIPASANGLSPDFSNSKFLYKAGANESSIVRIKLTGKYFGEGGDFSVANAKGGFKNTPSGYTWHHLDDFDPSTGEGTMQLIRQDAHRATQSHTGSVKQYELYNNTTYKRF